MKVIRNRRRSIALLAALSTLALATAGAVFSQINQQIPGNGPPVHGVTAWHEAGYTGEGVKVGVIDAGFEGIQALMGTEIPATVTGRCYVIDPLLGGSTTSNLDDCERGHWPGTWSHGTAVAETVMDMAPDASLYIANPSAIYGLQDAANWMVSQGVTVINHSKMYGMIAPGNGVPTREDSPLVTIDQAVDGGAVWVNSAGNEGQMAWYSNEASYWTPPGGDYNYVEFVPGDTTNDVYLPPGYSGFGPFLRWEDEWNRASTDLDVLVWDYQTETLIPASVNIQAGNRGDIAFEDVNLELPTPGLYGIIIAHKAGTPKPAWIQLWGDPDHPLEHPSPHGHIGMPAVSANPGMVAVGAANWDNINTIAPYSSRGPTPDGRLKPELVGADCGQTTHLYRMCGTSQSAPHVAGMAALVQQRFLDLSPVQVVEYLTYYAKQPAPGPANNTWGYGLAMMPLPDAPTPPPPTPTPAPTSTPMPTPTPTPAPPGNDRTDLLVALYDANQNGTIERSEVITAIGDYFAGLITRDDVMMLISIYFSGQ